MCAVATWLLAAWPTISTQVINECSHVLRRKLKISPAQTAEELENVIDLVQLVDVGVHEIRAAWMLATRYGFSHYDSLIIAAALSAGCATLYTDPLLAKPRPIAREDMRRYGYPKKLK